MKAIPPNEYRLRTTMTYVGSTDADGMNGAFSIPLNGFGHKLIANCIVSDGFDGEERPRVPWEHVSAHILEFGRTRMPTWSEMCAIKDTFWNEDELVVQYHPPKSEYVNCHPHVLHLWKPTDQTIPTPPKLCV